MHEIRSETLWAQYHSAEEQVHIPLYIFINVFIVYFDIWHLCFGGCYGSPTQYRLYSVGDTLEGENYAEYNSRKNR